MTNEPHRTSAGRLSRTSNATTCNRRGVNPGNEKALFPISNMAYIASHLKKGITHQQRVMRLYRNSLKHLLSWCIDRESWREEALILRDRFDKYKNETNPKMIDKVLQDAEIEFENKRHPFPYIGKCCTLFSSYISTAKGNTKMFCREECNIYTNTLNIQYINPIIGLNCFRSRKSRR